MIKRAIIHGLAIEKESEKYVDQILDRLAIEKVDTFFTQEFAQRNPQLVQPENVLPAIPKDTDLVFSLGGDGTFLETLFLVGSKEIPILGINMGRLGFLASIAKDYIKESLYLLFKGQFKVERRSLIALETDLDLFDGHCFALNECAILRKDLSSMI